MTPDDFEKGLQKRARIIDRLDWLFLPLSGSYTKKQAPISVLFWGVGIAAIVIVAMFISNPVLTAVIFGVALLLITPFAVRSWLQKKKYSNISSGDDTENDEMDE